jgi:Zn-dependent peptidase ImmA (M78 family)/transcriptional regulator with XRE-family HTH domain
MRFFEKSSILQKNILNLCRNIWYNFLGLRRNGVTVMEIDKRLKIAREAIGFTLEKASIESGIGISSINEFENGKREPKFAQLAKLAEVYRKGVEFFLSEGQIVEPVMLWREEPATEEEKKRVQTEFEQLCEQYHRIEGATGQIQQVKLPGPDISNPEEFNFSQAEAFARKVRTQFCLGDIPSASLKKVLEEKYYVKIFHLEFSGSAISSWSPIYGYAVLLNSAESTKQWRRNYDLAHELFHLCTMNIFGANRKESGAPSEKEEKLANAFASVLLMPEEALRERIDALKNETGQISFDKLDDTAREFDVSFEALLYRIANLYGISKENTKKNIESSKKMLFRQPRDSGKPDKYPKRYASLAIRALNEGRMSLMQFAKYMEISYKQAEKYLVEDEDFTDEKISIPVA